MSFLTFQVLQEKLFIICKLDYQWNIEGILQISEIKCDFLLELAKKIVQLEPLVHCLPVFKESSSVFFTFFPV